MGRDGTAEDSNSIINEYETALADDACVSRRAFCHVRAFDSTLMRISSTLSKTLNSNDKAFPRLRRGEARRSRSTDDLEHDSTAIESR